MLCRTVRYFLVRLRQMLRKLPMALCALALLAGLAAGLYLGLTGEDDRLDKIELGLVGTAQDRFLQMGLQALQTADDSRFSVTVHALTREQAHAMLAEGKLHAYVVIPEGFMENAMYGKFLPLEYVGTTGGADTVSLFKEEFTRVIGQILSAARKGVYGLSHAMQGDPAAGDQMNTLALEYVQYVLIRSQTYRVEQLGIADALQLEDYLLCGITVVLLGLLGLPFAALLTEQDLELKRLLRRKGVGSGAQVLTEYSCYFLAQLPVVAVWFVLSRFVQLPSLWRMLGSVFAVSAVSFLLYQLSSTLISGVLLQFFAFLTMSFVSGCMYPVFFFPVSLQKLGAYLPTGVVRSFLAGSGNAAAILLWGGGALALAVVLRRGRLGSRRKRG